MRPVPPPAVILVRPSEPGNIGAVARAMANTGLDEMIIVGPAAPVNRTARAFAVGAAGILDHAVRFSSFEEAVAPFQKLVGTSSHRSRLPKARMLTPREVALELATSMPPRTALVFGPERSGLTTGELARCAPVVRIPAAPKQPTLNLAQAVLILAYEIFSTRQSGRTPERPAEAATASEIEGLLDHARHLMNEIGFQRDDTFPAVFRDLRRLANRAELTPREVQILRGVIRRTENHLIGNRPRSTTDE